MLCDLKIEINNKEFQVKAIVDTGNFLSDPITKTPVVVVEKDVLIGIIEDNILNNLDGIIDGRSVLSDEYALKLRLIPFSSLGKENGLLIRYKI